MLTYGDTMAKKGLTSTVRQAEDIVLPPITSWIRPLKRHVSYGTQADVARASCYSRAAFARPGIITVASGIVEIRFLAISSAHAGGLLWALHKLSLAAELRARSLAVSVHRRLRRLFRKLPHMSPKLTPSLKYCDSRQPSCSPSNFLRAACPLALCANWTSR